MTDRATLSALAVLTEPIVGLLCCCCGSPTTGRQWWNRDDGYGLCPDCIGMNRLESVPMGGTARSFGIRGYHWDVPAEMPSIDKHPCFTGDTQMEQTHVLPNGSRLVVPDFRGDVPQYLPPDREAWAARHPAPYALGPVHRKYVSRATAAVNLDASTIGFDDAMKAQGQLDAVTARVHADLELAETTLVFFDSTDAQFWAYPA